MNQYPMRILYTVFLLFLSTSFVFSQNIQFGPVQGNAVLRSHLAQESIKTNAYLKRHFGFSKNEGADRNGLNMCPPDLPFNLNIVESGKTIGIDVDTFGLAIDSTPPTITLLLDPPLQFGTATYFDASNILRYIANPGLSGIASDTVLLRYQQGSGAVDTILKIAIDIRREARTVTTNTQFLDPGEIVQVCLNNELDFPTPRVCFQLEDCFVDYDGNGNQFKYFSNDSCIVYGASRFPGTDTVCLQICDEIGICDFFKIPFVIIGDTLSIGDEVAFFEDFTSSNGPFPATDRWLDDDVFVNNTFARNPPSVGMATFDGLSRGGQPYELPAGGIGDRLTSKPIDLSGMNVNDNVFLRFFLAPKGYGQEPELDDEFYVEFRNKQGEWIQVLEIEGPIDVELDSVPPFEFYAVQVEDNMFFHDAFQMRFSAETSPGGYGDWWHLDYIQLMMNSVSTNSFPDFAFSTIPQTFLKNYTSIPLRHLQADLENEIINSQDTMDMRVGDTLKIFVRNLNTVDVNNFSNSDVAFTDLSSNNPLSTPFVVASDTESLTLELSERELSVVLPSVNRETLIDNLADLSGFDPIHIENEYSFIGIAADEAEFKHNDTATLTTIFSNYFAHDDGTAEIQFFFDGPVGGEQAAVQYKTNVKDTLKGIRFMFPHFSFIDFTGQFFNLVVWPGDENGPDSLASPLLEMELLKPFYPDENRDTLQGFTTYQLEDIFGNPTPLVLEAGTYFYIGFKQLTTNDPVSFPIGYDLNNPCNCNFWRLSDGVGWRHFTEIGPPGALMVQPVFGNVVNSSNSTGEEITGEEKFMSVFPNPATNLLNIEIENQLPDSYEFYIFNQIGQMVDQGVVQQTIDVGNLMPGNYYLQVRDKSTGELWIEKFIVAR